MRNDLKKHHVRKESDRHHIAAHNTNKQEKLLETAHDAAHKRAMELHPEVKGKDIDLMNYTDL